MQAAIGCAHSGAAAGCAAAARRRSSSGVGVDSAAPLRCAQQHHAPPRRQRRQRCALLTMMKATSSNDAAPAAATAATEARVRELEAEAMAAHAEAQALNKAGRFDDAKVQYERMRALDAEALRLANSLGCPSCRSTAAAGAVPDAAATAAAAGPEYSEPQRPSPWPSPAAAARARGAVLGAAVGDAAAMGVQWIYDLDKLGALLAARREAEGADAGLEFYEPPQSPFFSYASGRSSPYGEGAAVLLRSLARENGAFDARAYAALYAAQFADGSFDGYRNASTTGFLRNHARGLAPPLSGADDAQADCVARLASVVAAFAGDARLLRVVAAATRTTQNTDDAEAWACAGAVVLERLIVVGGTMRGAVAAAIEELRAGSDRLPAANGRFADIAGHLQRALDLAATPHAAAVDALGRNCHMPNAACTPLHAVLHREHLVTTGSGDDVVSNGSAAGSVEAKQAFYTAAIRDALAAGGCCASRAGFAGACLGALLGPDCVPPAWAARADAAGEAASCFEAISAARGGGGS